jgi:integrase
VLPFSMITTRPPGAAVFDERLHALLLVGFAGALRRSELVALNVDDVDDHERGFTLRLRVSKTDQEREGRRIAIPRGTDPETCPVRALRAWLSAAAIGDGPLFRSVDRHGNIAPMRMSGRAVSLVIKRAAQRAGFDPDLYSGHSLRAGFATTAAANGASERAIANQTGHRSMEVLRRYIRHGTLFTDNAATMLGL